MKWSLPFLFGICRAACVVAGVMCLDAPAWAHKSSDAYLKVASSEQKSPGHVSLQLSLALKDADAALDTLDANEDRKLTWREIRQASPTLAKFIEINAVLTCGGRSVDVDWIFDALEQRTDGRYIRMRGAAACYGKQALALHYQLLRDIDPTHRLLVSGNLGNKPLAFVLAPSDRSVVTLGAVDTDASQAKLSPIQEGLQTLQHFSSEGVSHILSGYDHLAFLLALLLPISLRADARGRTWAGVIKLMMTVTSFTIGHSITLALAGLGWISASAQWVEPMIAISIGLSALLNLYPIQGIHTGVVALGFGLIHGLGFSGALLDAAVSEELLVWALAGFNLGVEGGQLMLVALWCAVSFVLSNWMGYQRYVVKGGSVVLLVLSLYWTIQAL